MGVTQTAKVKIMLPLLIINCSRSFSIVIRFAGICTDGLWPCVINLIW